MFNISLATGTGGTESEVPVPNAKVPAAPKLRDSAKFSVLESIWNIRTHEQLLSKLTVSVPMAQGDKNHDKNCGHTFRVHSHRINDRTRESKYSVHSSIYKHSTRRSGLVHMNYFTCVHARILVP